MEYVADGVHKPEKHIIFLCLVESPDMMGASWALTAGGVVARILSCVVKRELQKEKG